MQDRRPARPSVRRRRTRDGFTLIEVMAAALVMVTVFLAGFGAMRTGFELVDTARNATLASQIMQSELEDLRLKNWAGLPGSGTIALPANLAGEGVTFTASRLVEDVVDHGSTMKRVVITVNWKAYTGRNYTRTYETRFSKNGINDYFVTSRD